jgi:hypothetical protein
MDRALVFASIMVTASLLAIISTIVNVVRERDTPFIGNGFLIVAAIALVWMWVI